LPARWQFVAAWSLIPLLVFMLARSRLPLYVLPLFAPLSLAIAGMIPASFAQNRLRAGFWIAALVVVLLTLRGYASVMPYKKDSRALAEAISERASGPYRELVFVDQPPRYGLSLYLDAEIEHVCMRDSCEAPGLTQDERLDAELVDREGPVLYLMRPGVAPEFLETLGRANDRTRMLGETHGLALIELR
jgi:hypothetical protein